MISVKISAKMEMLERFSRTFSQKLKFSRKTKFCEKCKYLDDFREHFREMEMLGRFLRTFSKKRKSHFRSNPSLFLLYFHVTWYHRRVRRPGFSLQRSCSAPRCLCYPRADLWSLTGLRKQVAKLTA
jgi:hypothetical protein